MNKNKSLFKNKYHMMVSVLIFILLLVAFIYLGSKNYKETTNQDKNNNSIVNLTNTIFEEKNVNEISNIVNSQDSAIILMGSKSSKWTNKLVLLMNEVAETNEIKTMYFYDFLSDRKNNILAYEALEDKLKNYLLVDDEGNASLYSPTVLVIKNGNVLYLNDDTAFIRGSVDADVYWNQYQTDLFKSQFQTVINDYKE